MKISPLIVGLSSKHAGHDFAGQNEKSGLPDKRRRTPAVRQLVQKCAIAITGVQKRYLKFGLSVWVLTSI
jgi:hypothetical protein